MKSPYLVFVILFLLATAVYLPSMNGEFIMDDWGYITQNPVITDTPSPWHLWTSFQAADYWPLSHTGYWLFYRAFGEQTLGYHLINVGLHALNASLLFILAGLFGLGAGGRLGVALLFLLHPLHVQAVSWIIQFKTLLATTFALVTLISFEKFLTGRRRNWYGLALSSFALSLLAKTSTVFLPFVLVLMAERKPGSWKARLLPLVPFFALALAGGAVTLFNNQLNFVDRAAPVFHMPWYEKPFLMTRNLVFYLSSFTFPFPLSYMYPFELPQISDWRAWMPPVILSLLVYFARSRPALRPHTFYLWAYLLLLLPSLGLVAIPNMKLSLVSDHWAYLPDVFLVLGLGAALAGRVQTFAARGVVAAVLLLCAGLSFLHAGTFATEKAFWRRAQALNPQSAVPAYNLGTVYGKMSRDREAIQQYETAIQLDPKHARAWYNKGRSHFILGEVAAAREGFEKAIELDPKIPQAYVSLAKVATTLLERQKAVLILQQGLSANPGNAEILDQLAELTATPPGEP